MWALPVEEIYISPDEFALQVAYEQQHPSIDYRLEYMIAQLTAVVCHGLGAKNVRPSDFMLSEQMRDKTPTPADVDAQVRAMFGGIKGMNK